VYTPVEYIPITEFVQDADCCIRGGIECGYTLTYTAKWNTFFGTTRDLPPYIIWDQINWRFEVYSDDPRTVGEYDIELEGAVDVGDMNPPYKKSLKFKITIQNGCDQNIITVVGDEPDKLHYINEDPAEVWNPSWSQSVDGCPVEFKLYRTQADGTRTALTAFELAVLSTWTFPPVIPVNVP